MIYSIGVAAKMLGVSRESLRVWEKQGLIPKPQRILTKNLRRYSDADLEAVRKFLANRKID